MSTFSAAGIAITWLNGYVLQWFRLFPVPWCEGATTTYEFLASALVAVIEGHVVMALTHRDGLLSILKGMVADEWARRHAPEQLYEESRTS